MQRSVRWVSTAPALPSSACCAPRAALVQLQQTPTRSVVGPVTVVDLVSQKGCQFRHVRAHVRRGTFVPLAPLQPWKQHAFQDSLALPGRCSVMIVPRGMLVELLQRRLPWRPAHRVNTVLREVAFASLVTVDSTARCPHLRPQRLSSFAAVMDLPARRGPSTGPQFPAALDTTVQRVLEIAPSTCAITVRPQLRGVEATMAVSRCLQ
jgi:hypothetical protein